jgi:hypothetical protein
MIAASPGERRVLLFRSGLLDRIGLDNICPNIDEALNRARAILKAG